MCRCVNIELGSYANQTVLDYPAWFVSQKKERSAGIDNCILEEIKSLWAKGIQTVESCCGHNKTPGYIYVLPDYHFEMVTLGYEHFHRTSDLNSVPEMFKPKSI